MRKAPKAVADSTDEDSDSNEQLVGCKKRKTTIKSGKRHMANTTVLRQINWPHELVYGPGSQPTIYDELPLPLFIQGYLAIIESERPAQKKAMLKHLSELMANAAIYGWE